MADKKAEYQKQYNDLKAKYQAETNVAKRAAYEKAMKRLEPYVTGAVAKASDNVAKASAATHALNNTTDVSMASKDPSIKKIVDADKKRDEAKKKDSGDQRNQADVHSAEADVLRANADAQDALHMTGNQVRDASGNVVEAKPDAADDPALQASQKSEAEILHDKLLRKQLTDQDLLRIYELYQAGKWPYGFGPQTKAELQRLGKLKAEPAKTEPKPEGGTPKASSGYIKWRNSERVLYWDLYGQLKRGFAIAGSKDPDSDAKAKVEELMQSMYNLGRNASTASLKKLENEAHISDISGDNRPDFSVASSIRSAWKKGPDGYYSRG